ncbi:PTS sugar transporter subunit IIA [Oenococcus sicerae]|uniref:Ascorbate-specific PTS system EIIA component n=1 Tax=Oenococcus sicerae TaxID=2203724 RepID=A0AAJ1VNY4_9LACO|nr:PTS sugar transporter subunit IIA [Oenococcus sicerae]MDN6900709.1 PTS sugar transporter subunit IIA [Oenococcus sicerae]
MLSNLLKKNAVTIIDGNGISWCEVIQVAAEPLVNNGSIMQLYVNSIIETIVRDGPYMNIGPRVALIYTPFSKYVRQTCISLLKSNVPIALMSQEHMVNLWFVIAFSDAEGRLKLMRAMTMLLTDPNNISQLLLARDVDALLKVTNTVK